MGFKKQFGLRGPVPARIFRWHAKRIECVNVPSSGQNVGRAQQITAGYRGGIVARQSTHQRRQLGFLRQQCLNPFACFRVIEFHQIKVFGPRLFADRTPNDMQAFGDKRVFGFEQPQPEGIGITVHIDGIGLFRNERF